MTCTEGRVVMNLFPYPFRLAYYVASMTNLFAQTEYSNLKVKRNQVHISAGSNTAISL